MIREQIIKKREALEKQYLEDTLKVLRMCEQGWSFCAAAARAGVDYKYALFLRKRNPEFNSWVEKRTLDIRKRKKQP